MSRLSRVTSTADKFSLKTLLIVLVVLLIPIVLLLRLNQKPLVSSAAWWNDSWQYRQRVDVANPSASNLTDFQVSLSIGTSALIAAGKMQTNCADIRLTDNQGKVLPHWIEANNPGCNQLTDTKIWVKVPSLPSSGAALFFYYGNASATDIQNGNTVFDFFDDFNDSQIDTNKWTFSDDAGALTTAETASVMRRGGTVSGNNKWNNLNTSAAFNNYRIVEYQLKVNSKSGGETIMRDYDTTNYIRENSSGWKWQYYTDNWYDIANSTNITTGGNYVNIKLIAEPTGLSIYENDTLISKRSYTITTGSSRNYFSVRQYSSGYSFSVDIDNVRIRQYATSDPTTSAAAEETSSAPVAYWKFDEGVGTSANNATSTTGIPGILVNNPVWQTDDQCISGKCLYFDGTNDYISVPQQPSLYLTDKFTLSFWVKNQRITGKNTFLLKNTNASQGYAIWQNTTDQIGLFVYYPYSGGYRSQTCFANNFTLPQNQWTHIAASFQQDNYLKVYINGKVAGSCATAYSGPLGAPSTTNLYLGYQAWFGSGNDAFFKGYFDDVKIYPYARTAAQIQQDYNAGKSHTSSSKGSSVNMGSNAKSSDAFSNGLIGYWKFDENVGTSSADYSGNNNTTIFGSGTSAPSWSPGKYGVGLSFNNTGTYTSAPVNGTTLTELTYSFYFNIGTTSGYAGIMQWATALSTGSPAVYVRRNGSSIDLYNSGSYSTPITVTPNSWHLFTATYKNSVTSIYIDGTLGMTFNRQMTSTYLNNATILYFGNGYNGFFDGLLDEFRLYSRALSSSEIRQLADSAPGPVGFWNFEEGTGTTFFDSSGYGNNGGWIGTASYRSPGKYGTAGNFTADDYISVPESNSLKPIRDITVTGWVKFKDVTGGNYRILSKAYQSGTWNSPYVHYELTHDNSAGYQYVGFRVGTGYAGTNGLYNVVPNRWYYLTGTYDGSSVRMYIDGNLIKSVGYTGTIDYTNSTPLEIGRMTQNSGKMNGLIDDLKMYNYARTPKQITEDMNAGHPAGGSPVGSQTLYWKFDEGFGTKTYNAISIGSTSFTGTLTCIGAGCTLPTWTTNSKYNKGLYFSGLGNTDRSYVTTNPLNVASTTGEKITLSLWVNPDQNQLGVSSAYLIRNGSGVDENYGIYLASPSSNIFKIALGGYFDTFRAYTTTGYYVPANQWSQVTIVFSQGEWVKFYVNGQLKETSAITYGPTAQSTTNFNVGGHSGSTGQYLNGYIDEVKVYNYALTDSEIALDYNHGTAMQLGSLSTNAGNTTPSSAGSQEYCLPGDVAPCAPPIARWDFEEGAGTTAFDTSGNGNNGLLTNSPSWINGKFGKGLSFNGSNSKLSVPDSSALRLNGSFTIEGWYRKDAYVNSYPGIFMKGDSTTANGYILFQDNSNILYFKRNGQQYWVYANSPYNTWQYLTLVFNSSTNTLNSYLDGMLKVSNTGVSFPTNSGTSSLDFGKADEYGKNSIDNFRFFDYARTPAQIAFDYNKGTPIAWWKFDDCQGNTAYDASGIGNTGNISIGPSGTQTSPGTCSAGGTTAWGIGASGKNNAGLNFDGVDDYVSFGSPSTLNILGPMSISLWAKSTDTAGRYLVKGSATYMFSLGLGSGVNSRVPAVFFGGSQFYDNNVTINDNLWHHLVATYDPSQSVAIYIDGIRKVYSTTSIPASLPSSAATVYLGGTDYYLSGQLDDLRVYNYSLTSNQISTLYNGGAVNFK